MDRETCKNAGIDYEEGVSRFVGNADIYEKFLRDFVNDPTFSALESALSARDIKAAFQAAHTLKGVTGNLSLTDLYSDLVKLTDALRGEGDLSLADSLYPAVRSDYERAISFISAC